MVDYIREGVPEQEDTVVDDVIVQLDSSNAYNNISRTAIYDMLMHYRSLRPLARFFCWSYGSEVPLYDRKGRLVCYSKCGVRQGDPLGGLFFVFGIHEILEQPKIKYPDVDLAAYLDDICMMVRHYSERIE
jgi:hypothetical protein